MFHISNVSNEFLLAFLSLSPAMLIKQFTKHAFLFIINFLSAPAKDF